MSRHDTALLIAERRIQQILLDLIAQILVPIDFVEVDTRNFANFKTAIHLVAVTTGKCDG